MSKCEIGDLAIHTDFDCQDRTAAMLIQIIGMRNENTVAVAQQVIEAGRGPIYRVNVEELHPIYKIRGVQEDILAIEEKEHNARIAYINDTFKDIEKSIERRRQLG